MRLDINTGTVHQLVDLVYTKHSTMPADKKLKAVRALHSVPLSKGNLDKLSEIDDVDFTPEVECKKAQRFEDVGAALEDAVESGVNSLEAFQSWLGMGVGSEVNDIIDRAHAYMRLGERGRPETIAEFR